MILTWCANKQYMNTRFIHGVIVHILKSSANTCNDRFGIWCVAPLSTVLSWLSVLLVEETLFVCTPCQNHEEFREFPLYLILDLISSAVDRGFEPRSGQTKKYKIGICWGWCTVLSWLSVLLVEETGVPGENHRSVRSHWQLYHITCNVIYPKFWKILNPRLIRQNKLKLKINNLRCFLYNLYYEINNFTR
jgi:hypothetical protein